MDTSLIKTIVYLSPELSNFVKYPYGHGLVVCQECMKLNPSYWLSMQYTNIVSWSTCKENNFVDGPQVETIIIPIMSFAFELS